MAENRVCDMLTAKKMVPAERFMDITELEFSNKRCLDRASPVYAMSTVTLSSFERREITDVLMVQEPGFTIKSTVTGVTRSACAVSC